MLQGAILYPSDPDAHASKREPENRRRARHAIVRAWAAPLPARWNLDDETAKNLISKGIASATTIAKAITAEGWPLWHALGVELTGETYAEAEERRLHAIIEEAEHARQNIVGIRAKRAALESRAGQLDPLRSWAPVERHGGGRG